MAGTIIKRADAKAQGLKRYFTGKLCKRGHIAERYVCNLDCVICVYDKTKIRQWHKVNPEKHLEHNRKSYQRNKEARGAYRRKWTEANPDYFKDRWNALPPEERRAKKKAWYQANRDHVLEYNANWEQENIDQVRERKAALTRRRRVQKLQSPGQHTAADLAEILAAQENRCAYCRADFRKVKKHLDHIHPLSRGGSNARANLQWLCRPCNLQKGAKDPLQFAKEAGRLF